MTVKITVLCDNHAIINSYLKAEPGLSFYIEDQGKTMLFDTGLSEVFLENAQKLGISLEHLDYVVLSHGHDDHTGGLVRLMEYYKAKGIVHRPKLLAHPAALKPKEAHGMSIGNVLSEPSLRLFFEPVLTKAPLALTERLLFLGQMKRRFEFEAQSPTGYILRDGQKIPDNLEDDTALAYNGKEGLVIITGCSHSGICNITEQAKELWGESRVQDIIGGFHLLHPTPQQAAGTLDYLKELRLKKIHPCHCTGFDYLCRIHDLYPLEEMGCGVILEYD